MKTLLIAIPLLINNILAIGQTEVHKEKFDSYFLIRKDGGQFLYNGKSHSFTVDVVADSVKTTDSPNFILVNEHIVQSNILPLPSSSLDLTKLSSDQQKEILEGYVKYEMDYFKDELKLNCQNLNKEWITINSKLWLVWTFDLADQKVADNLSAQTKTQIYSSTICFNQILDLNTIILPTDNPAKSREIVDKLMASLKLSDKRH